MSWCVPKQRWSFVANSTWLWSELGVLPKRSPRSRCIFNTRYRVSYLLQHSGVDSSYLEVSMSQMLDTLMQTNSWGALESCWSALKWTSLHQKNPRQRSLQKTGLIRKHTVWAYRMTSTMTSKTSSAVRWKLPPLKRLGELSWKHASYCACLIRKQKSLLFIWPVFIAQPMHLSSHPENSCILLKHITCKVASRLQMEPLCHHSPYNIGGPRLWNSSFCIAANHSNLLIFSCLQK